MNLKAWKALKNTLVSLAIVGFAVFAISEGANPLQVAIITVIVVGLINGMEVGEFWAAYGEVQRTRREAESDEE
jgi:hypothetical protein